MTPGASSEARLTEWLRSHLAESLPVADGEMPFDRPLSDYGLDSVDAILIAGELEEAFAIEIEPAAFLQYATIAETITALAALVDARDVRPPA